MSAKPECLEVGEYFRVSNQLSASAFSNSLYIGYMVSVGVSDKYVISFDSLLRKKYRQYQYLRKRAQDKWLS